MEQNFVMEDIKGYEGKYAVTTTGLVWSYKSNKFLKPGVNSKTGYLFVNLGDKEEYVHRLVAKTFIPPFGENPGLQVDHIDNDKTNNFVSNLQWLSHADNLRKDQAKVVVQHVIGRPNAVIAIFPSMNMANYITAVDRRTIKDHCEGKLKNKSLQQFRYATAEEAKTFQYNNK